jgi:hypothetical protein
MPKPHAVNDSWRRLSPRVILVAFSLVLAAGCQSFAPGSLAGLSTARKESRILKEAQNEPFPSPADVGLASASAAL